MELYIEYLNSKWIKLQKLPPPNFNEISDANSRILLLAFFGFFDDVFKYDIDLLKTVRNIRNDNLYLIASYNGQIDVMKYLENKGFDINFKNNNGNNAYLLASLGGKINVMKYLENKGFDINSTNNNGSNAYLLASTNGQIDVMKYLEDKGFDINFKNNNGSNAYLFASLGGKINVMKYLENKIIINKKIKNVNKIKVEKTTDNINCCIICEENKKDYICIPCGHVYMCGKCANKCKEEKCGICRGNIESIYKIYN